MKDKLTIIKVGGGILNDQNIFEKFLFNFSKIILFAERSKIERPAELIPP